MWNMSRESQEAGLKMQSRQKWRKLVGLQEIFLASYNDAEMWYKPTVSQYMVTTVKIQRTTQVNKECKSQHFLEGLR
jgi:hypothetical protein